MKNVSIVRIGIISVFFSLLLILSGCTNSVIGTYENTFEKGAIHQIIINEDSTYKYIYKTSISSDSIIGKWNYSSDNNILYLDNWRGLGKYNKLSCPDTVYACVTIRHNTLIFSPDLPDEENFTKK